MQSVPLISIIVPVLNEERDLPKLLEDLEKQIEKRFEVIIVDGKSQDSTKEKVQEFAKKLQIKFIEVKKRNVSYQRNTGADNARSTYLFFLDADTRIDRDCIKKVIEHIIKDKKSLYLPYIVSSKKSLFFKIIVAIAVWGVVAFNKLNKPHSFGPAIVIQKELFEKIGKFDEKACVSEDHNLVIKAHKAGVKPTLLSDVNTVYSMRRFESEGVLKVIGQYAVFIFITLFKGVIYKSSIEYKMEGGEQHHKRNS